MDQGLPFRKYTGTGNDFVLMDNRAGQLARVLGGDLAEIARRLCAPHTGLGADGLELIEPAPPGGAADFTMRIFNADGSEAEMCGNGSRCLALFAHDLGAAGSEMTMATLAGPVRATLEPDHYVRVRLTPPRDIREVSAAVDGLAMDGLSLNTGVPHFVVWVDSPGALEATDIRGLGRALRFHEAFAPRGTNVNFACRTAPGALTVRTYERGVEDETLACGTGSVACALAARLRHGDAGPLVLTVRSGEQLRVHVPQSDAGGGFPWVDLEGRVRRLCQGFVFPELFSL